MTPEQKGKELIDKFEEFAHCDWHEVDGFDIQSMIKNAKQCAIICCNEILAIAIYFTHEESEPDEATWEFWQSVKEEIQKL